MKSNKSDLSVCNFQSIPGIYLWHEMVKNVLKWLKYKQK